MSRKHPNYSQDDFSNIVSLIYDAALNPDSWVLFLRKFAEVLKGVGPNLFVQDLESNFGQIYESDSDPGYQQLYAEHFSKLNEWLIRGKYLMQPGKFRVGQMVISEQELRRTEYYNEWLRPQNFLHGCGATILQTGSLTSIFSMFRPHGSSPFEKEEIAFAETLIPHLQRAIKLHHHFADLDRTIAGSWNVLEQMNVGVIVVKLKGKIVFINSSAEKIINQKDGIHIQNGCLTAERTNAIVLRKLIAEAIHTSEGKGFESGGEMHVDRHSTLRPYFVSVTPFFCKSTEFPCDEACAIIFIQDPENKNETSEEALSRLFRFTPAEARLAAKMLEGKSISEIAEEIQISRNTARSRLKSLFLKTNTNRQSELIRHLLSLLMSSSKS